MFSAPLTSSRRCRRRLVGSLVAGLSALAVVMLTAAPGLQARATNCVDNRTDPTILPGTLYRVGQPGEPVQLWRCDDDGTWQFIGLEPAQPSVAAATPEATPEAPPSPTTTPDSAPSATATVEPTPNVIETGVHIPGQARHPTLPPAVLAALAAAVLACIALVAALAWKQGHRARLSPVELDLQDDGGQFRVNPYIEHPDVQLAEAYGIEVHGLRALPTPAGGVLISSNASDRNQWTKAGQPAMPKNGYTVELQPGEALHHQQRGWRVMVPSQQDDLARS